MEKWKKAVVNLESVFQEETSEQQGDRISQLQIELSAGNLSHEEFIARVIGLDRQYRSQGTAVFLKHNDKHYLLTAQHVVADERGNTPLKIFRVPTLDQFLQNRISTPGKLLNGPGRIGACSFSNPELDLAVISLNIANFPGFADELIASGCEPISTNDISDEPLIEGAEVFTVGFPGTVATIGELGRSPAVYNWSSNHFSQPTFSFGRVAMFHEQLDRFWADISIYPGNSGGPMIVNDKLVGIVSAQATIPVEGSDELEIRIPFANIIKVKPMFDLIETQLQKDLNSPFNQIRSRVSE